MRFLVNFRPKNQVFYVKIEKNDAIYNKVLVDINQDLQNYVLNLIRLRTCFKSFS